MSRRKQLLTCPGAVTEAASNAGGHRACMKEQITWRAPFDRVEIQAAVHAPGAGISVS